MENQTKQRNNQTLSQYGLEPWHVIAISGIVFLWILVLWPSTPPPSKGDAALSPQVADEDRAQTLAKINQHLQYLEKKSEIDKLQAEAQNKDLTSDLQVDSGLELRVELDKLAEFRRTEDDDSAHRVYEDLHGPSRQYDTPLTPEAKINSSLAMKRWMNDYEQHQKFQYVKEFVENAREQGFDVKLNDNLEVVEIARIPKDKVYKGFESLSKFSNR